jgi:hypothetical protein
MVDSDEILAIGSALVETVRSQIKYSPNMCRDGQLFDGLTESSILMNLVSNFDNFRNKDHTSLKTAKEYLESRTGLCDGLSLACIYIAKGLEEIKKNTFYLSLMGTGSHAFVLAHSSRILYNSKKLNYKHSVNSLLELSMCSDIYNAVIIDPWIYKATKLKDYLYHLKHAKLYNCEDYYIGDIKCLDLHITISPSSPSCIIDNKYICIFNKYYRMQKDYLLYSRESFARGRRYSSVRKSLEYTIKIQLYLKSFICFLESLKQQCTSWYSFFFTKNRTDNIIDDAINCINMIIKYNHEVDEIYLVIIFQGILRILPVIASENTMPRNISIENIYITPLAENIFHLLVVPENKYPFEKIDGLDLDWIRNARYLSKRARYKILLEYITTFTPPFNLNKILPSFYEYKDGYYQLLSNCICEINHIVVY